MDSRQPLLDVVCRACLVWCPGIRFTTISRCHYHNRCRASAMASHSPSSSSSLSLPPTSNVVSGSPSSRVHQTLNLCLGLVTASRSRFIHFVHCPRYRRRHMHSLLVSAAADDDDDDDDDADRTAMTADSVPNYATIHAAALWGTTKQKLRWSRGCRISTVEGVIVGAESGMRMTHGRSSAGR